MTDPNSVLGLKFVTVIKDKIVNLQLKHVDFSYNRKNVFSDLSLNFPDDGLIAIVGNNGSGKSTLLKLLAGIIEPSAGQVIVDDIDYKQLGAHAVAQMISYVPQFLDTAFGLSVIDFLLMMIGNKSFSINKEDFEKVYAGLECVGMQNFVRCNINELSGGERQKILIAAAVSRNTPLMLLDEPISHLDWNSQIEIFKLLREIAVAKNRKIIIIAHDINLVSAYCEYVLMMKNSKPIAYGRTSEILKPQMIQNVFGVNVHTAENYFIPEY